MIEATCDLSFFKGVYFSCDIGLCKPNKQAYKYVLDKINRNAKDCVFIDDREANLIPATELGMRVILYKDLESLKKELLTIY